MENGENLEIFPIKRSSTFFRSLVFGNVENCSGERNRFGDTSPLNLFEHFLISLWKVWYSWATYRRNKEWDPGHHDEHGWGKVDRQDERTQGSGQKNLESISAVVTWIALLFGNIFNIEYLIFNIMDWKRILHCRAQLNKHSFKF